MPTMKDVFARRAGRLAFGVVLLLGAAHLVSVTWSAARAPYDVPRFHAAGIIALTWVAAAVARVMVQAIAARLPGARAAEPRLTRSWVIPTLGAALLLPLTLHLPIALLAGGERGFDAWVAGSLMFTGPAHLVFAILSAIHAHDLAIGRSRLSPRKIYGYTVAASCLPFVLLLGIPPALVAITGLPILPLLRAMERPIARERAELSAISVLPRATAMLPPE